MRSPRKTRTILLGLAPALVAFAAANSQSIEGPPSTERSSLNGQTASLAAESRTGFQVAQDSPHEPAPNPLLVVRERLKTTATLNCGVGLVGYGLSYSELTVFVDGQVEKLEWTVPPCSIAVHAFEWKAPTDGKIRQFMFPPGDLERLRSFLDRPEVKALRDFMNAGPGVGDYDIEIHRTSGVQRVPVASLMPSLYELKQDPTLLRVICRAKEIRGDDRPAWCADLPRTQPVSVH